MSKLTLDGTDLMNMIFSGAQALYSKVTLINNLNVFPVPDGDTGTNMSLTLRAGIDLLNEHPSGNISEVANVFAKGLLMGARGNSGVIMSQLFRGFARSLGDMGEINGKQFAEALLQGVNVAYEAVTKPVEGTILTVSREAAQHGMELARSTKDIVALMKGILYQSKETLTKTPEMLAVLKQAGVVDSGGQGLVCLYEGFHTVLENGGHADASWSYAAGAINGASSVRGNSTVLEDRVYNPSANDQATAVMTEQMPGNAQAHFSTESIDYPYDMEFFIFLGQGEAGEHQPFHVDEFRHQLAQCGDSVVVIAEDDIVKVHVHTDEPDTVLKLALQHGELGRFHIENMRLQHQSIVKGMSTDQENARQENFSEPIAVAANDGHQAELKPLKACGVVAVSMGEGITHILQSLGVDMIVPGGQTMNPSTAELLAAIDQVQAETVIILPNNSNIILAAEQAQKAASREVAVIPTVSIPQGISALFSYRDDASLEENAKAMESAAKQVKTGQITRAVRDSKFDTLSIREGHYIGLFDGKMVSTHEEAINTGINLLQQMISDTDEIVTIILGEGVTSEHCEAMTSYIEEHYPELEIEVHQGGQPVYDYIIAVE